MTWANVIRSRRNRKESHRWRIVCPSPRRPGRASSHPDPDLKRDIEPRIRAQRPPRHRALEIRLTTPACPVKDQIKDEAKRAVEGLPGVQLAEIEMTSEVRSSGAPDKSAIAGVKNLIAIGSGKGGVGKSTVSVNLACSLRHLGARVGLLDCDIYGPSIPLMMGINEEGVERAASPDPARGYGAVSFHGFHGARRHLARPQGAQGASADAFGAGMG
jgi:hypothetical protein